MKINKNIKIEQNKLDDEFINKYGINFNEKCVMFNNSTYSINIPYDKTFKIIFHDVTTEIKNKKMAVTLWNNVYLMHTTVY